MGGLFVGAAGSAARASATEIRTSRIEAMSLFMELFPPHRVAKTDAHDKKKERFGVVPVPGFV
jgi:hypothetical protein